MNRSIFSRFIKLIAFATVGIAVCIGTSSASEFTANIVTKQGPNKVSGKLYVKGNKIRQDLAFGTTKRTSIVRGDKGITWTLNHEGKRYTQWPGLQTGWPDEQFLKKATAKRDQGKEKISGYMCDKILYEFENKQSPMIMTLWVSDKLDWPLKIEIKRNDKTVLLECEKVKEKKLANSLFELPKGYKKLSPNIKETPKP